MAKCPICQAEAAIRYSIDRYRLFRCKACHHLFLHPIPSLEELQAGYSKENTTYVNNPIDTFEHLEKAETMSLHVRRRLDELLKQSGSDGYRRFLDVGAGSGKLMRRASKFGWTVEGIEPGQWGAKAAKRYQLTIYPIMVEDIPKSASIQSKIYDMITMIDVVEHLRDPLLAVQIVSGLLKPGGILVMQFPYSSSVVHWTRKHRWPLILLPGHIHYFSKGSTESLLSQSGLTLIDDITDAHTPILPKARWYPINKVDSTLQKGVNTLNLGDLRTIFCQKG